MRVLKTKFQILKTKFQNNSSIGLFGFATDNYCLLPINLKKSIVDEIKKVLQVPVYKSRFIKLPSTTPT